MAEHRDPAAGRGYEKRDANLPVVLAVAGVLALIVVISFILMRMLFGILDTKNQAAGRSEWPLLEKNPLPPAPRLRVDVTRQLRELRAWEDEVLTTYAWIDETQGVARIPIDVAMHIVAARGSVPVAAAPVVSAEGVPLPIVLPVAPRNEAEALQAQGEEGQAQ